MFSDEGGYYIFDNGLIIEWGYSQVGTGRNFERSGTFVKMPYPFPHKMLAFTATNQSWLNKEHLIGRDVNLPTNVDTFLNVGSLINEGAYVD